jgi:hypothetical protein
MTRALTKTAGLSAPDTKVLRDIQRVGWHVTGVFAKEGEDGPEWAFSSGLFHSFGHPEVVVFGLPFERCMDVVNVIGEQVKAGSRYDSEHVYADILNDPYKCAFREVNPQHYRDYVGFALWFYEDDPFPLLQCFWPDKQNRLPWENSCNEYVKKVQPLLFAP